MTYEIASILVDAVAVDKQDLREYHAKREKANVYTGTTGEEGWTEAGRTDVGLAVQRAGGESSGLSIECTQTGVGVGASGQQAGQEEAFAVLVLANDNDELLHSGSWSAIWIDPSNGTSYAVNRFSVPYNDATAQDTALRIYGGHGIGIGAPDDRVAYVPGASKFDSWFPLRFRDVDVAHGITTLYPTDVFGAISAYSDTNGGVFVDGLADAGATGFGLRGIAVTPNVLKNSSAAGVIELYAAIKNTTGKTSVSADGNLLVLFNDTTPALIVDAEGYEFLTGGLAIADGVTAPSAVSGFAIIYVDTSDGDLKVKFADGTVKTLATDT